MMRRQARIIAMGIAAHAVTRAADFELDQTEGETEADVRRIERELLDIARSTLSEHLNELKKAGLIQGEINPPYIKYCINKENWAIAKSMFGKFFED